MKTKKDGPPQNFEVPDAAQALRNAEDLAARVLRIPKAEIDRRAGRSPKAPRERAADR